MARTLLAAICLIYVALAHSASAQGSEEISYQGFLTDANDAPYTGTANLTFALYDIASGGSALWSETHNSVAVSQGIFEVLLGRVQPLSSVDFDTTLYLGTSVNGGLEMTPRMKLGATPKALGLRGLRVEGDALRATKSMTVEGLLTSTEGVQTNLITTQSDANFQLHLGSIRVLKIDWPGSSPNILLGHPWNAVSTGVYGATISGGGFSSFFATSTNRVNANFGTISGGYSNVVSGAAGSVPGGSGNRANGTNSLAAGFRAGALTDGSFVWSDRSQLTYFESTSPNQFLIRADGGVGIGTNAPTASLDVTGWSAIEPVARFRYNATSGSERTVAEVVYSSFRPGLDDEIRLGYPGYRWSYIYAVNNTILTSDRRLKRDIADLSYGLREVLDLRPVSFSWKNNPDEGRHLGLIAQEALLVTPEVVDVPNDPQAPLGLQYGELIPVLIKSIQELKQIVDEQGALINALLEDKHSVSGASRKSPDDPTKRGAGSIKRP